MRYLARWIFLPMMVAGFMGVRGDVLEVSKKNNRINQKINFDPLEVLGRYDGPRAIYVFVDGSNAEIRLEILKKRDDIEVNIDRENFEELHGMFRPAN